MTILNQMKAEVLKEFESTYVEYSDGGTLVKYVVHDKPDLDEFISQALDTYSQRVVEELEKEKIVTPSGECPFAPCNSESTTYSSHHPQDADSHYHFVNYGIDKAINLIKPMREGEEE